MNETSPPFNVLLVEDNPDDAELVERALGSHGTAFSLEWTERLAKAMERVRVQEYHAVLLDLNLPDHQGLDTFLDLHALAPHVPIVILSGLDDEAVAQEGVKRGAQDFLMKDEMTSHGLARALRYAIERQATARERETLTRALDQARAEAVAARTRADLIADFAHNLRTPLTPLRIAIALLQQAPAAELGPKQREVVELLDRNVGRFADLVESILHEAGIDEPRPPGQPALGSAVDIQTLRKTS